MDLTSFSQQDFDIIEALDAALENPIWQVLGTPYSNRPSLGSDPLRMGSLDSHETQRSLTPFKRSYAEISIAPYAWNPCREFDQTDLKKSSPLSCPQDICTAVSPTLTNSLQSPQKKVKKEEPELVYDPQGSDHDKSSHDLVIPQYSLQSLEPFQPLLRMDVNSLEGIFRLNKNSILSGKPSVCTHKMNSQPMKTSSCSSSTNMAEQDRKFLEDYLQTAMVMPFSTSRGEQCKLCMDRVFHRRHDLTMHIRTEHLCERRFECNICMARFKRKSHLEAHINSIHETNAGVRCKYCDNVYASDSSRRKHIRSIHGTTDYY
jgi:hypothetical protein